MSKIVIMESLGISAEELSLRKKPFEEQGHTFVDYPRTTDIPTLIAQAKDADAILINVARGPVVVSQDLADALNNGTIAAAGIDVFDKEPSLDLADPLLNCKNCLVTPHVAFATKQSMSLRAEIVFDNLDAWMKGNQKNVIL